MLKAKAIIRFTLQGRNYEATRQLRPAFNLGDDLLFSGNILSENTQYLYNIEYTVDIEFFTIEDEAYVAVSPLLSEGMTVAMQEGSRLIGIAKLYNLEYVTNREVLV